MNNLDWALLQTFVIVAKYGSLSAASKSENLSQPTISRHIAQLEHNLGYRLFDRAKSGVILTEHGENLLIHASEMAEAASKFEPLEQGTPTQLSGTVRITASRIVSTFLLPEILASLRDEEPGLKIEVIASDDTENLLLREADIALRMFRPEQPDVITKKLGDLEMGAFATPAYLKEHGEPKHPKEIFQHSVIGYDRSTLIIEGFKKLGLKTDREFFSFRCDDQVVCWNMVCAGYGIGFNQLVVGSREPRVRQIKAAGTVSTLPIWLTAHSALKTNSRIRRVYDFLSENFKEMIAV